MLHRVYGLDNMAGNIAGASMNIGFCIIIIGIYMYVNTALFNLSLVQVKAVNQIIQEMTISQEVSKEFFDMF